MIALRWMLMIGIHCIIRHIILNWHGLKCRSFEKQTKDVDSSHKKRAIVTASY